MILDMIGQKFDYNGKTYTIGGTIIANAESEYDGLRGVITEIRDGDDKDTENDTPDIYCYFEVPDDKKAVKKLEETFSELYEEKKTIDDIILDDVIMAPSMIEVM